ncbi:MAG: hypothetical protein PHG13_02360 [Candidatus Pacebacteria bacterium]|jgi:uncharacterized protein Veg|nr:hypothetical protein [Candidatus Paceibacterota bacterium]MDD5721822.1 hypothetical protein [Candidatus Paceibacterota bacterium]
MNKKSIFLSITASLVILILVEVILMITSYRASLIVENQQQEQNDFTETQEFFDILGETILPKNLEAIDGDIIEIEDNHLKIEMIKPMEIDENLEELNRLGQFPVEKIGKQVLAVKILGTTEIFVFKDTGKEDSIEPLKKQFMHFEDLAEGDHVFISVENYIEDKDEFIAKYIQIIRRNQAMNPGS